MICALSKPIPIPKKNNIYSLNNNIFDPANSSPPNEFMLKLNWRSNHYFQNSPLTNYKYLEDFNQTEQKLNRFSSKKNISLEQSLPKETETEKEK